MPKVYTVKTDKKSELVVEAENVKEAKKIVQDIIDDKELPAYEGKITSVEEVPPAEPDNRAVKQDGGFYFPGYGIHVAAGSVAEAKKVIKQAYDIDVDKDPPFHPEAVKAGKADTAKTE